MELEPSATSWVSRGAFHEHLREIAGGMRDTHMGGVGMESGLMKRLSNLWHVATLCWWLALDVVVNDSEVEWDREKIVPLDKRRWS